MGDFKPVSSPITKELHGKTLLFSENSWKRKNFTDFFCQNGDETVVDENSTAWCQFYEPVFRRR
jgi:hypothetical protein